jgi:hypothetical protein
MSVLMSRHESVVSCLSGQRVTSPRCACGIRARGSSSVFFQSSPSSSGRHWQCLCVGNRRLPRRLLTAHPGG